MRTGLLIGISEYRHPAELPFLPGCINDVDDMRGYLAGIGVNVDPSRILKNADATKDRIVTELAGAIAELKTGDELIVHYSGHGTPFPQHNAVHDALCPYDFDWGNKLVILDVDLADLLARIPAGARVSFVADSCYSGGLEPIFDALLDMALASPHVLRTIPIPPDIAAEIAAFRGERDTTLAGEVAAHDVVLLAACGPKLTAADAFFGNRANGAMTFNLLQLLNHPPAPPTASDLVGPLQVALRQFSQVPELHGRRSLFPTPFLL